MDTTNLTVFFGQKRTKEDSVGQKRTDEDSGQDRTISVRTILLAGNDFYKKRNTRWIIVESRIHKNIENYRLPDTRQ